MCDTYGDFTLTNEDYDGTEVGYQISYNCERYRQDIGGAQTFAATMFVALAALLLLNWKVSKTRPKQEINMRNIQ